MRSLLAAAVSIAPLLATTPVSTIAHHSVAALYDQDAFVETQGELTRVVWGNPHVLFRVTDGNGKNWNIETNALGVMERFGITSDLFVEGQVVRIAGHPRRRSDDSLYATNVLLPDGREVLMEPASTARWSEETVDFEERKLPSAARAREAEARARGIFRVWTNTEPQQWTVTLTEAALAARNAWDPLTDDPRLDCIAPGMVDAMTSPYPIELIDEEGDVIVIRMEEWDAARRVYLNASGAQSSPRSPMGHSVGHWEGNTLVVATNRINWPYFDSRGTPQSQDVEIIERFALSEDEQSMNWEAIITDAENLAEPAVVTQGYQWVPGEEIMEFNCVVSN